MKNRNNFTFLIKSTKNSSFGTGFCIHKDNKGSFLVTVAHVVNACGKENLQVDVHNATLLHISNEEDTIDLALIYVEGLTNNYNLNIDFIRFSICRCFWGKHPTKICYNICIPT